MTTLRQLERAFLKAHEAGDTENAQLFADELRRLTTPEVVEEPTPQPKTGFMPNVKASIERLKGDYYAGLAALGKEGAAEEAEKHRKKAGEIATTPEFTEHPVDYITSLLGQSVPYMAAPLAAGVAATPLGELAALGAAGAASATQFTGSNLSRQLETGTRPEDLQIGKAAAAAVPQAALDVVGLRYIPGIRGLFGRAGVQIGDKEAAGIVDKYIIPAFKTAGVEGGTEAAQQVFERLQAGLSLTDPEARKEYFDNFLGGAVLGGTLSVPGSYFEGGRKAPPEQPVPATEEPAIPRVASVLDELQPISTEEAAPTQLALPAPEAAPQLGYTPTKALPAPEAKEDIYKLMEHHDTLKNSLDPLADKIEAARKAGDHEQARALTQEYRDNEAALNALNTKITDLGGITQSGEEVTAEHTKTLRNIDAKIDKLESTIREMSRADVRDYDAVDKAEKQVEKLKAERAAAEEEFRKKQDILRIKETPKGEQIPLFAAEEQQPTATEPLKFKTEAGGEMTAADIEQATQGPQRPDQEQLNAAAEKAIAQREQVLQKKQEELNTVLQKDTQQMNAYARENHEEQKHQALMQVRQLQNEIDAIKAGKPVATIGEAKEGKFSSDELYGDFNLLNTAIQNQDRRTIDRIAEMRRKADLAAFNAQHSKLTPREEVYEMLKDRIGGILRREKNYDTYEATVGDQRVEFSVSEEAAKEIARLRNIVEAPRERTVNGKKVPIRSMLQNLHDLWDEYQAREDQLKTLKKEKAAPEKIAKKKAQVEKAKEKYQKQFDVVQKYRQQLDAELAKLYKQTGEFAPAEGMKGEPTIKTPRQKQAELEALGRSERKVSRPVRAAVQAQAGNVKVAEERVAKELGEQTEDYAAYATPRLKKLKDRAEKYNAFLANGKEKLAALKERVGETSEKYKTTEANFVKAAKERLAAFREYEAPILAELKAKAAEFGRAHPEFAGKLAEAQKDYTETVAAGTQEVKSLRTPQATRKLPKLSRMQTSSEESKAASQRRQENFEAGLSAAKGEAYDYQQRQEAIERTKKAREAKAGKGNAMQAAMTAAANKKMQKDVTAALAKEEGKALRGSEIESKNLTEEQVNALENNDISAALNSIIDDDTNSPVNRAVAVALEAFLDATNVSIRDKVYTPDGQEALGMATSKQIDISKEGLSQETLLHEGVHAAAERVIAMAKEDINQLSKEQQAAYRELERLFKAVKADPSITSVNAKSDISEFAAEALSNENLQKQLRAKKWTLGDAFKSFTSFILKMIGVKNVDNMMDASLAAVEALMVPSSVGQAVTEESKALLKNFGVNEDKPGIFSFMSKEEPTSMASSFVGKSKSTKDTIMGNVLGLTGRVQFIDKFAALSKAFKEGLSEGAINSLEALQGEYYLRYGEQRSQFATQALTNGSLHLKKLADNKGYIYESRAGANMMQVAQALSKAGIKNDTQAEAMLTAYVAGLRADKVGWNKLNLKNPAQAQQEHAEVMAYLDQHPQAKAAFEEANKIYQEYNNGLIDFLVQTGAMSKEQADMLKSLPYVPYYRMNGDTVELMVDKEHPVRIGNIKDEPELQQLVGSNDQIMPIFTSAVQNTFMLTNMALRNQMVKDSSFLLHKMGIVSKMGEGSGPAGPNTVRFKVNGKDNFAVIDKDQYGIPADLIVKGMEGIKTTMPFALKAMGVPADILRKFVTRNPAYAIKQAIRDPLTAWMTTGTDGVPILNSFKELSSMVAGRSDAERKLMESGAISSNVFTGDQRDMDKALRDITSGKPGWAKLFARMDAFAMQGDAATRAVVYKDSIAKGMSEMEALLRTLESMNFSRRGLSPSMQAINVMVPFFNAQIQGLDVLYRAFKGDMPFNEQLEIRKLLFQRGLMLAAGTLAYAALMQDDDAYKNAKPEERLGNWFMYLPGQEEPVKIPVPFELGYLFKSLPEAVMNMGAEDRRSEDIVKGMGKLAWQSNPFSLPAAIKPITETYLNKSFFSGDIESQREIKTMLPTQRARESTTEVAKLLGSLTGDAGLTPIKWDYLTRGYTGSLGIGLVSLANPLLNTETSDVAKPAKKMHETPFIGGMFQPVEGRGTLDAGYERMLEIQQAKGTFDRLRQEGKTEEAREFLEEYRNKITRASLSGAVQQRAGELAKMRRDTIANPFLSEEQKTKRVEQIDRMRNDYIERFLKVTD